jgi:hypothetical protein
VAQHGIVTYESDDHRPVLAGRAVAFVDGVDLTPAEIERAIQDHLPALEADAVVTVHVVADGVASVVGFADAHEALDVVTVLTESTGRIVVLRVG